MNKCNELEKEIADAQENHVRDTEEWKKFQADLQTAVRVANDFMNGESFIRLSTWHNESIKLLFCWCVSCFYYTEAEEKVNKMKEDYTKAKEREQSLVDEIEKLRKKVNFYETKSQSSSYLKKNKGMFSVYLKCMSTSLL